MRTQRRAILSLLVLLFLFSGKQRAVTHPTALDVPLRDVFSHANARDVRVNHVSLDLTVDFNARTLTGRTTLDIENLTGAPVLVLDTYRLDIHRVTHDGAPAVWQKGTETSLGEPLTIVLPPGTRSIAIDYTTHPTANGLYWSNAADTSGGPKPFLYSLNTAIGARSWIPLHDTPAARMTFDATLRVTPGLLALMTAADNARAANGDGVYRFTMPQSIPAYLIAFAVAPLEYRAIDARTGVYAEPHRIADAAWELQYLPAMMAAAEALLGPHPFPRHDLLIMPPGFPGGGMEHPMLNFIQAAAIPANRVRVPPEPKNLIAHELAHSWAGDSATLSTWHDVWINEGFASYLALRILEELRGPESVRQRYVNDRLLVETYVRSTEPRRTTLHRTFLTHAGAGFDIPSYVKGELFLRTLEDILGRAAFDAFLRDWYATYSFRWVDARNFLALLREHAGAERLLATRAYEWVYQPGLPDNLTVPRELSVGAADAIVEEWFGCHTAGTAASEQGVTVSP